MACRTTTGRTAWTAAAGALALAWCLSGAAAAQDEKAAFDREGWRGALTLGVGLRPDYEGSDDYEVIPVPMSRVEWRGFGFYTYGTRAMLDVLPQHALMGGPMLHYRFGRDDVEDSRVDALPDVDDAVEAGAFFGIRIPTGEDPRELLVPTVTFLQDLSGGHSGWLAAGHVTNTFVLLKPLALELGGTVTYASEDYEQAYFGIDPAGAAASGLDAYEPGGGFKDVRLHAALEFYLSRSWSLGTTLVYKRLVGEAADSPIVEDAGTANQFTGFVTATWRF